MYHTWSGNKRKLKGLCRGFLAKFRHRKWPLNSLKYKTNLLKQLRNISIAHQIQKKVRMAKSRTKIEQLG